MCASVAFYTRDSHLVASRHVASRTHQASLRWKSESWQQWIDCTRHSNCEQAANARLRVTLHVAFHQTAARFSANISTAAECKQAPEIRRLVLARILKTRQCLFNKSKSARFGRPSESAITSDKIHGSILLCAARFFRPFAASAICYCHLCHYRLHCSIPAVHVG